MVEDKSFKRFYDIFLPIGYGMVYHPISHCRVLMQLGYEPDPPFRGHSITSALGLGQKVWKYPSIVTYVKRVTEKIGWSGLFLTGLPSRILYVNISGAVTELLYDHVQRRFDERDGKTKMLNTDKSLKEYVTELTVLAGAKVTGIMISYPFEVIMIRQMAEIMEDNGLGSSSMLTWIGRIFKEEGIVGFYGGVWSKVVGELLTLSVAASVVYGINNYVLPKKSNDDMKDYTPMLANMVATQFSYKHNVIAAILAVSGSSLSCAVPLQGFSDAYWYLKRKNAFARGSSMFIRLATWTTYNGAG